jgi:hypothetical protein
LLILSAVLIPFLFTFFLFWRANIAVCVWFLFLFLAYKL